MWKIPYMKDALIFDFDGVIADSLDFFYHSYNKAAERVPGIKPLSKQRVRTLLAHNPKEFLFPRVSFLKKIYFSSILIEEMKANLDKIKLVKGMKYALENLFLENELYISSKNLHSIIVNFLSKHGLRDLFSEIYSFGLFGKKSSFRRILKRHSKKRVLFITDTYSDIIHATSLKINSIGCTWGLDSVERLKRAHPFKIVNNWRELLLGVREWKLLANKQKS